MAAKGGKTTLKSKARSAAVASKKKLQNSWRDYKKQTVHRSFRVSKRSELPKLQKLPSSWRIVKQSISFFVEKKVLIPSLLLLYVVLAWAVNGMFSLTDFNNLSLSLLGQSGFETSDGATLFGSVASAQNEALNQNGAAFMVLNVLNILLWLTIIWIVRYELAKKVTSLREAFYTSGTTLVPFVALLFLLFLQLVPGMYGVSIIGNIATGNVFEGGIEASAFLLVAFLFITFSIYFVCSTLIALQIVALPGMYPWRALQNARRLLAGRRLNIVRKCLVLIFVLVAVWVSLFVPTILLQEKVCGAESCWVGITIVPFVYYLLFAFSISLASAYLYVLYRSLLHASEGV